MRSTDLDVTHPHAGTATSPNRYLLWSGIAAVAGALLHVAAIFGGPSGYRLIGATEPIVRLAATGHWYPVAVCLVAACVLLACSLFAFSAAGLIPRLPFLKTGLVLISAALLFHGVAFIPLVMWRPDLMIGIYDGEGINSILIVTSIICLAAGLGYALGARQVWSGLRRVTR